MIKSSTFDSQFMPPVTVQNSNQSKANNSSANEDLFQKNRDLNDDSITLTNADGSKIARKAVFRKTIDYNSSVSLLNEQRATKRKIYYRNIIQPDIMYQHLMTPPMDYRDNPMNCVCANHVRTSTNKNKCPIYAVCWTPDGRRLITGASSGEFTLWNGLTFNFETILQAHDTKIRAMKWSHNEEWLISADELGFVKYWQTNMNDVNVFQAHKDSVRGLSICPSDKKFVTCSSDNTVRVWDFYSSREERVLRGHGADVTCVGWHPTKSLVISGSKDCQQPIKLWDPKAGECISTMYVHKSACTDVRINKNGNWFVTASKDHSIKLFDIRNLKSEMQVFRGHQKDVTRVAWHPYHETLLASGSMDGALLFWLVGTERQVESVEDAHDNTIWSLDWHPMGHILTSGSNDFATKFWTRSRPGDMPKDNNEDENQHATKSLKNPKRENSENTKINQEATDLFLFDIDELSSEIQAEIGETEMETETDNNQNSCENIEEKDGEMKGAVNKIVPKQFQQNWENKKSVPMAYNVELCKGFPINPVTIFPTIASIINISQSIQGLNIPQQMNQLPQQMNQLPQQMIQLPQQMIQLPQQMIQLPQQMNQLPQQMNQLPQQMNQLPQQMNQLPQQMNQLPQQMNQLPQQMNQLPQQMNQLPQQMNQLPQQMNQLPQQMNQLPQQMNQLPQQANQLPQQMNQLPQQMNHLPQQMNKLPQQTNQLPQQMNQLPQQMNHLPQQMNQLPQQTNQLPQQMNQLPQQMNQLPQQMNHLPQQMNQLPQQTNQLPQQMNQLPQQTNQLPQQKFMQAQLNMQNMVPNIPQMPHLRSGYQSFPTPRIPFGNPTGNFRQERPQMNEFNDPNFHDARPLGNPLSNNGNSNNRRPFHQEFNRHNEHNMHNSYNSNRPFNNKRNKVFNNHKNNFNESHENPFEPSKATGSSKSFIRLSSSFDEQPNNRKNNRTNNNNRQNTNW